MTNPCREDKCPYFHEEHACLVPENNILVVTPCHPGRSEPFPGALPVVVKLTLNPGEPFLRYLSKSDLEHLLEAACDRRRGRRVEWLEKAVPGTRFEHLWAWKLYLRKWGDEIDAEGGLG